MRRSGGPGASRQLTLVSYSTSGPSPLQRVTQNSTIQFVGTSELVSSGGQGGILAACYGSVPCHVSATITAGGTIIGSSGRRYLGANEASHLPFRLNSTGQSMLTSARGNQLAVQVTLTNGASVAAGQVVLSRYS